MKILITGAGGFIGRNLIPKLKGKYDLLCLTRSKHPHLEGIQYFEADLRYLYTFQERLEGIDVVINLAANLWKENHTMYLDNVVAVKNLIEACKKKGVKRFIQLSSNSATEDNITEYGKTKLEADKLVISSGLNYTILKPTMVYGKDGGRGFTRILDHIKKYPIVPVVGHGKTLMQPVYVEDVVEAIIKVIENPISIKKSYNIAGPKAITMNELFDSISKTLGKKKPKLHIPLKVIYFLTNLMHPFNKKKRMSKEGIKTFYKDANLDIQETINDLKYNPLHLEEGLAKSIK
ncbi:MAG: NAD-dependent epimerase/dehydratase family protein [Candidatus Nanoarchaeia archaeon]|nr:NAD-dependent epimerase/dehydratase family protein [Candidatus Nanoarchaeia archaeon]